MRLVLVVLLILAAWTLWCHSGGMEGFENGPSAKTIFVSVPSYRDETCLATLKNLFDTADNPKRVYVGCCEQNTDSETEVCRPANMPFHDRVRLVSVPYTEAKGPTYARALCAGLYRGEDYFLSIDAHSTFAQGWDTKLIQMLAACPGPDKAILTHYPPDVTERQSTHVPRLCSCSFGDHGLPVLKGVSYSKTSTPVRVPFLAGGMWFAKGHVLKDVPMDPTLDFLFQGEEFLLSARCWTSGYDMYTPTENVVFHDYGREHAPRYWDDLPEWHEAQRRTVERVRQMLGFGGKARTFGIYGLGTARTLKAYYAFAGIDPKKEIATTGSMFCRATA